MKTMKPVSVLAAAIWLLGLAGTPALNAAEGNQTHITIEALIFSGRPNPTWSLQDTNGLHLLKAKLKDLPVAFEQAPGEWSRLGFGGFVIRGGEAIGLPCEIRIYQGVIKAGHGKEAKYLKDSPGLEQSLIAEAKKQALEPPVKEAITKYESARKAAQ